MREAADTARALEEPLQQDNNERNAPLHRVSCDGLPDDMKKLLGQFPISPAVVPVGPLNYVAGYGESAARTAQAILCDPKADANLTNTQFLNAHCLATLLGITFVRPWCETVFRVPVKIPDLVRTVLIALLDEYERRRTLPEDQYALVVISEFPASLAKNTLYVRQSHENIPGAHASNSLNFNESLNTPRGSADDKPLGSTNAGSSDAPEALMVPGVLLEAGAPDNIQYKTYGMTESAIITPCEFPTGTTPDLTNVTTEIRIRILTITSQRGHTTLKYPDITFKTVYDEFLNDVRSHQQRIGTRRMGKLLAAAGSTVFVGDSLWLMWLWCTTQAYHAPMASASPATSTPSPTKDPLVTLESILGSGLMLMGIIFSVVGFALYLNSGACAVTRLISLHCAMSWDDDDWSEREIKQKNSEIILACNWMKSHMHVHEVQNLLNAPVTVNMR